jgi:hypothetical protein
MQIPTEPAPRPGSDLGEYVSYLRYLARMRITAEQETKRLLAQAEADGFDRTALRWSMWMHREPSTRIATLIEYLQAHWERNKANDRADN